MIAVREIAYTSSFVTDVARARAFYEGHFGFTPTYITEAPDGSVWWEYDIGGAALCFGKMEGGNPSDQGTAAFLEMEDFDQAIADLQKAGVRFVFGPIELPTCRLVVILDSEGNKLGLHKRNADHPCNC